MCLVRNLLLVMTVAACAPKSQPPDTNGTVTPPPGTVVGVGVAGASGAAAGVAGRGGSTAVGSAGRNGAIGMGIAGRGAGGAPVTGNMGLAGMGNSGTVLAALFAPVLAKLFGWNAVMGLAVIPLAIVFVFYLIAAKDSPDQPEAKPLAAYAEVREALDQAAG